MATKKEKVIYKKNFLDKVILRFDFDKADLEFLSKFSEKIKSYLPVHSQEEAGDIQVLLNNEGSSSIQHQKTPYWRYQDVASKKTVDISSTHCLVEYSNNSYTCSEDMVTDLNNIIIPFLKEAGVETVNRVGLRYINRLDFSKSKVDKDFKWNLFIEKKLLSGLDFIKIFSTGIKRKLEQIQLINEDVHINMTHGIFNKDYPAKNVRKEYLLDIDAYSAYPIEAEHDELIKTIQKYNKLIQKVFEKSITNNTRDILNKK